jgi:hypothetical protein
VSPATICEHSRRKQGQGGLFFHSVVISSYFWLPALQNNRPIAALYLAGSILLSTSSSLQNLYLTMATSSRKKPFVQAGICTGLLTLYFKPKHNENTYTTNLAECLAALKI